MVDTHGDACAVTRQARQPVDLGSIPHLIRDEYVLDTGARKDFGLRDLLAADPNRPTELLLQAQHVDGFVHFSVRAVAHVVRPGIVAHLVDVALERIEIEDQARRLDLFLGHAGNSRDIISDLEIGEFAFDVHVLTLPYCQGNLSRSKFPSEEEAFHSRRPRHSLKLGTPNGSGQEWRRPFLALTTTLRGKLA